MASIVFQTNKDTGITYAYESISYWDKEKQQSRARRKLIGKRIKKQGKLFPRENLCHRQKWILPKKEGQRRLMSVPEFFMVPLIYSTLLVINWT